MENRAIDLSSVWPRDTTVVQVLTRVFEEIRWNYPQVRVCCGAFRRPTAMHFVASAEPPTMSPMTGNAVVGDAVERYRAFLSDADDAVSIPDVRQHALLAGLPATVVGDDTIETVVLPLSDDEGVVGFVRMDARSPDVLSPRAVEELYAAADTVLLAVTLEPELADAHRQARDDHHQIRWLCSHVARQRDALEATGDTITSSARQLEELGKTLDPAAHHALRTLCSQMLRSIETATSRLDAHVADAPHQDLANLARLPTMTPASAGPGDTPTASVRSIDGTRE